MTWAAGYILAVAGFSDAIEVGQEVRQTHSTGCPSTIRQNFLGSIRTVLPTRFIAGAKPLLSA